MRTTVTLDPDVERLLKIEAHKRGKSFKVVLNEAIRQSLGPRKKTSAKPLLLPAHSSGLRPGFTWDNLSDQAEELEDREIAARLRLPMKPIKRPKAQVHAHS